MATPSGSKRRDYDDVPSEVWREILSYIPVKYLLRFRSVSRTWKSIIEQPEFASLHLTRFPNNSSQSHLIFHEKNHERAFWVVRREVNFRQEREIVSPVDNCRDGDWSWDVVGSVNGLFLLKKYGWAWATGENDGTVFLLWNPSIKKALYIPPPPATMLLPPLPRGAHKKFKFDLYLGFDQPNNDYKVVVVIHQDPNVRPINRPTVEIFSLRTRSWRVLSGSGGARCVEQPHNHKNMVFCGGCINWLGRDYPVQCKFSGPRCLVSFDLSSELFSYTPFPTLTTNCISHFSLVGLEESRLALLLYKKPSSALSIWVLEMDRSPSAPPPSNAVTVGVTWVKRYEITVDFIPDHKCLYFTRNREMLVCGKGVSYVYDPDTQQKKVLSKCNRRSVCSVSTYTENLVLLT